MQWQQRMQRELIACSGGAIDKARMPACDVVILDLEDAVALEAKVTARRQAVDAVAAGGLGPREVVIRVNELDTPWGRDDLVAADGSRARAMLAPKDSVSDDVIAYHATLHGSAQLWQMIKPCAALLHLDAIGGRASDTRLSAWII